MKINYKIYNLHVSLQTPWGNEHINSNPQKCLKKTKNNNFKMQKKQFRHKFCVMIAPHAIFQCPLLIMHFWKGSWHMVENVQEQTSM
jgi:hypothetical protein